MEWRIFFKKQLKFGQRLKRLHHGNAILFVLLALTGFILFSEAFRSMFPTARVIVRASHVTIGVISCLPLLFYFPKLSRHLDSLNKRKPHRQNLYMMLSLLILLTITGFILLFHRQFPPFVSSGALFFHDLATLVGVPYVTYHSITRSRWFKRWTHPSVNKVNQGVKESPLLIEEGNPIYKRRTFLKMATGTLIGIAFLPVVWRWLQVVAPSASGTASSPPVKNNFQPLPEPSPGSSPPIGGGRTGQFRYYTVTEIPQLNDQNFSFAINGLVNQPVAYNWEGFLKLKRTVQVSDFHCVTGWNVNKITWEGIPLSQLLAQVGVKNEAKVVKFYSADGVYTDTLTLSQAKQQDVLVALLIDGQLISQKNGGPVRLIVPKMFGYKSVKWLNRIELINHDETGYWEARGYPKDAWVKKGLLG